MYDNMYLGILGRVLCTKEELQPVPYDSNYGILQ